MKNYFFSLFLVFLCACQVAQEPIRSIAAGDVKSVTTTFISHQGDTQQKDDQIVSVADFHPDGSLAQLVNHMTYPYDYAEPETAEFWSDPNGEQMVHLMDGLEIGGTWNFLYGNDWPKKYAGLTEGGAHPVYGSREFRWNTFESTVPLKEADLPIKISSRVVYDPGESVLRWLEGYDERFEYSQGKVSLFETEAHYSESAFVASNGDTKTGPRSYAHATKFEYEGDNLSLVEFKDTVYKYFYENGRLVRSEFHLRGKMRNHRLYFYDERGLKDRTEIFNTFGEPEYTIQYHYEFYETI